MNNLKIEKDSENYLSYRYTPWDTKNFGLNTNEILDIVYKTPEALKGLLIKFDALNAANDVRFTYTRVDANDKVIKASLQEAGFYYAETSFVISKNDILTYDFLQNIKNPPILTPAESEDFEQIREIARYDFHYSRFHEDIHIDIEKARFRFYNWIDSLVEQKKEFSVYKLKGEVMAFHCQDVNSDTAHLILSGTKGRAALIAVSFWAAFLHNLKTRNVKRAHTIISASNLKIINLYNYFDFKYEKTLVGFHKIYK